MKTSDSNQAIDLFYGAMWNERWPALRASLMKDLPKVNWPNPFVTQGEAADSEGVASMGPAISRATNGLLFHYPMGAASAHIADLIDVQPHWNCLDACAAPGGKSLVLGSLYFLKQLASAKDILSDSPKWYANELSKERRDRMKSVFRQYWPEEVRRNLSVLGRSAALFGKTHPNFFDFILLDAPCSGEAHLLRNAKSLAEWKPGRSRQLARQQSSMIKGLWHSLKADGRLLYSTCSVSVCENDNVIEGYLRQNSDASVVKLNSRVPGVEPTRFGIQIFPDSALGAGPMYFCLLQKT